MATTHELIGKTNRWTISASGARMVNWEAHDVSGGNLWRKVCRGDAAKKASQDNYHAGVMFPWVNRIGGKEWSFEGVHVPVNLSGPLTHLHGLVGDADWEVVSQTETAASYKVVLEPSEWYPRKVGAEISYIVGSANGHESLDVQIISTNLDDKNIAYVTTGIHPYFLNPFGGKVDEMELMAAANKEFSVDDRLIPTGLTAVTAEHDFTTPRAIGATTFDSGFVLDRKAAPAASLKIKNFRFEIHPGKSCGYAQIYIPPHREEIAIEPQTGGADAFRFHKYGLRRLEPGKSFTYSVQLAAWFG